MNRPSVTINPVLRRELIERWRGRRAFLVISAYVALLAVVTLLLYWIGTEFIEQRLRWGGFQVLAAGPTMGRFLFENLLAFVMLLVLFIAPGYAAAQISGERERRTLALLQITLVRPAQIVTGKLGASVAWLLLLVVTAMPVGTVAFFLGGVALGDLARGVVTLVVVAICVAAVSLGVSSLTRKTTASVVLTFGVVLTLVLGTLFGALVESAVREFRFDERTRPVALYANPFYGLADAVRANSTVGQDLPSVLTAIGFALPQPRFAGGAVPEPMIEAPLTRVDPAVRMLPGGRGVGLAGQHRGPDRTPVWLVTLGIYLLLGAAGFTVATRRVRVGRGPRRRPRPQRGRGPASSAAAPEEPPPSPPAGPPFVNAPPPPPGRE